MLKLLSVVTLIYSASVFAETRTTLTLNKPVEPTIAQSSFAKAMVDMSADRQKLNQYSITKDLLTRSFISLATGALVGAGVGSAVNRGHIIDSQRTMYATAAAATVPYFAFTFYPGNTSWDKGSLFDFTLITVGRGLCNFLLYGLGVNMGLKWSVGVGLSELI